MARIRTIKPEFWQDEKLAGLDPLTRLVFLGLISMADDAGRLVDNVKTIDGTLFPETEDSSRNPLDTLARLGRITRYVAASGQKVIQLVKWADHQRVDHPNKYTLPAPPPKGKAPQADTSENPNPRETLAKPSRKSLATTSTSTNDLGSADADAGQPQTFRAAEYIDDWRELRSGIPPAGQIAKALKPVEGEIGQEQTRHRWRRFLSERKHSPPAYFAQEHGQYAAAIPGEPDYVDTHRRPEALNGRH